MEKKREIADLPVIVEARERHFRGTSITEPFTLTVVGDIIQTNPISQRTDPAVRGILDPIRESDAAFGNMESNFGDYRHATSSIGGLMGCQEVAGDVKQMGFGIVARSSNHSTDQGVTAMLESNQCLHDQGIVYAGSGINLEDARAPQYLETPKGRIGLVAMTMSMRGRVDNQSSRSADCGMEMASYCEGNRNGSAGINFLRTTPSVVLPPELYAGIRRIKEFEAEYAEKMIAEHTGDVTTDGKESDHAVEHLYGKITDAEKQTMIFTQMFEEGEDPCTLRYHMNEDDLRLNLRSIRQGKEWSDLMIASIHTHDSRSILRHLDFMQERPSDYLVSLAHQAIDNGADVFVVTGPHLLRGIEIYKGRPIFYSLASFIYMLWGTPAGPDRYTDNHLSSFYSTTTETEMNMDMWPPLSITRHPDLSNMESMESVEAQLFYEEGKLKKILLRPIEFGYDAPISQRGIPRVPKKEVAERILKRMQRMSAEFGTEIRVENELGVIELA